MREHQVVINLKAQQFELLQRLAREKGYKSVSAFVKEKLLEIVLDVEKTGAQAEKSAPVELLDSELVAELRKIQTELRALMQDSGSLSLSSEAPASPVPKSAASLRADVNFSSVLGDSVSSAPAPSSLSSSSSLSLSLDPSFDTAPGQNSWPVTAGPAGAGALPVGPVNVVPTFDVNKLSNDLEEIKNTLSGEPSVSPPTTEPGTPDLSTRSNQAIPSSGSFAAFGGGNLGGFAFGLSGYAGGYSGGFSGGSFGSDRLSGYKDILDDLEELADRAFAISPRLGALEEDAEPADAQDSQSGRRQSESSGDSEAAVPEKPTIEVPKELNLDPYAPIALVPPLGELPVSIEEPAASPFAASVSSSQADSPQASIAPPATQAPAQSPAQSPPSAPVPPHEADLTANFQSAAGAISFAPGSADLKSTTAGDAESELVAPEADDDVLSELLDGDLVAFAQAPRAENPFAVAFSFKDVGAAADNVAQTQSSDAAALEASSESSHSESQATVLDEADEPAMLERGIGEADEPAMLERGIGEADAQAVFERGIGKANEQAVLQRRMDEADEQAVLQREINEASKSADRAGETRPTPVNQDTSDPGAQSAVAVESMGTPVDETNAAATLASMAPSPAPAAAVSDAASAATAPGATPAARSALPEPGSTDQSKLSSGLADADESASQPSSIDDEDVKPLINKPLSSEGESQDANGGGVSGFSGGPPPKRRRT